MTVKTTTMDLEKPDTVDNIKSKIQKAPVQTSSD